MRPALTATTVDPVTSARRDPSAPRPTSVSGWAVAAPVLLFLILAFTLPIDPWLLAEVTVTLTAVAYAVVWLIRRSHSGR